VVIHGFPFFFILQKRKSETVASGKYVVNMQLV